MKVHLNKCLYLCQQVIAELGTKQVLSLIEKFCQHEIYITYFTLQTLHLDVIDTIIIWQFHIQFNG